jgi:hypothetical protein
VKRTLLALLFAPALLAQPQPPARPSSLNQLGFQLERLEATMRERAAAIRRDAFLVSQVVAAVGELDDFQRNAALSKARDKVRNAQIRARENPQAPPQTMTALSQTMDLLDTAQKQSSTADIPTLRRDMLRKTHVIQQILFRELQDSRADRAAMTDLTARLNRMATELDQALGEALGSTFDYFQAGGQ